MTLQEIDSRIQFISEVKKNEHRGRLRDYASILFLGVSYGYASTKSKKITAKNYHDVINKLLSEVEEENKNNSENVENDLANIFR